MSVEPSAAELCFAARPGPGVSRRSGGWRGILARRRRLLGAFWRRCRQPPGAVSAARQAAEDAAPTSRTAGRGLSRRSCRRRAPFSTNIWRRSADAQAVLSHKSTHATGTLSMPAAGVTGAVEIFGAQPEQDAAQGLARRRRRGAGRIRRDARLEHFADDRPDAARRQAARREAFRFRVPQRAPQRRRATSSLTTLEQVDFEGRPCYKVRLVRKTGGEDIEFYDVATGLKAGSITTRETQMGTVTGTTVESEYKKFGNLLQPTMVKSQIGGLEQVITHHFGGVRHACRRRCSSCRRESRRF